MKKSSIFALFLALIMLFAGCQQLPVTEDDSATNSESTQQTEQPSNKGTATLIKYPEYPDGTIPKDYDYYVRIIQGDDYIELPVYNPVYASDYFTNTVYNFDQHRRYAEFAFTGEPVTVEITVNLEFDRYTVMPSSKAIPSEINGNVITYTLTEPCTTVLKLNNDKDTHLTIFAEAPETDIPDKNDKNVIYYEAGYHEPVGGVLVLTSNTTLYLEPGALVKARVKATGENVKICGRGAFIEPNPTRGMYGEITQAGYMCSFEDVRGGVVQDVRFLEAHCYNLVITKCQDITYEGVKLLCNQVSTDGLSVFSTAKNIYMNNCYFNTSDNVFVIGASEIENFLVENTITICDYAFLFPQGNMQGDQIVFRNMDVLRYSTFITHQYPTTIGEKTLDLLLENCTAIDSDRVGHLITSKYGTDSIKNYYLKNVSVPRIYDEWNKYITTTDEVSNISITFDNVWVDNQPLTKEIVSEKEKINYNSDNTVTYLEGDKTAVTTKRNDIILEKPVTPYQVYIGDRRIESRYQPEKINGKIHVSAYEILEAMLFENIELKDGELTFSYDGEEFGIVVADEKAMVDFEFLAKITDIEITIDKNRINITNPERFDNLLRDPDFEGGITTNWVTRNFTNFSLSTDAQSGKYAIRIEDCTWGNEGGIYQDIADTVRQFGTGKYRVTAWVKKADTNDENTYIRMCLTTSWNEIPAQTTYTVTDEWQKIEFTFEIYDTRNIMGLMLTFGQNSGETKNVLIDNVSMIKL